MKLSRSILAMLTLLAGLELLLVDDAFAGSGKRRGTSGAQELLIPIGGAGLALGGSFTAFTRGAEATYWNPAGVANFTGSADVLFSHMNYLADVNVEYAAVAARLGTSSAFAVSVKTLAFGDIPVTTVDLPDGTGETFSPTYLTFGLTYSQQMTDRILFGATAKLISEQIIRESATGVAFDFGLQYQSALGFNFGVVLRNLGPTMRFDGPDLEEKVQLPGTEPGSQPRAVRITAQEFELPSTLEFGVSFAAVNTDDFRARVSSAFEHQNFGYDDLKLGVEFEIQNMVFLRAGYLLSPDMPAEEKMYTFSVGGGLNFQLSQGLNLTFDYAYRQAEFFGDNQVLALRLGF